MMSGTIAGGLFNAFAFSGASYLFKFLDGNDSLEETERHNRAMEELDLAKERWYQKNMANKDRIERMRKELADANADINVTNKALDALRMITYKGKTFTREPNISDYYTPSDEMKEYMYIFIGVIGLASGWAIHKLVF